MTTSKIINLSPHPLSIYKNGEKIEEIPSSGLARAEEINEPSKKINDIPVVRKRFGNITGLPDPKKDTYYFVSRIILEACSNRNDLITSSKLVRDENGKIIGCEEFAIL